MGGSREAGAGAVQPWLHCPYHQAETWRCRSLKKSDGLDGKWQEADIYTQTPKRRKHHSSCKGVKDLAGKISHLKRENNIRVKKIPPARQCDPTP